MTDAAREILPIPDRTPPGLTTYDARDPSRSFRLGSGRVERTHAFDHSLCETGGVGIDSGAPVSPDYPAGDNAFGGEISRVRLEIGDDGHDHLLAAEQLMHFAMSRQ